MAIEIVDFPIKHGDFPVRYVSLPEGYIPFTHLGDQSSHGINPSLPSFREHLPEIRRFGESRHQQPRQGVLHEVGHVVT